MNSPKTVVRPPRKTIKSSSKTAVKPSRQKKTRKNSKLKSNSAQKIYWLWLGLECLALLSSGAMLAMLALGYVARRFTGNGFFANLLPFAVGVVGLVVITAIFLILWVKLRLKLQQLSGPIPAVLSLMLTITLVWYIFGEGYKPVFTDFRALVGGKQQAAAVTLAHQVYAAYRRYDETDLQKIIIRSAEYRDQIQQAAKRYDLDPDLLMGIAATESSFLPRDSKDGGHGLFQITAVPKFLLEQARDSLAVDRLSLLDNRHNAFVAAATLKYYLAEMHDDLFLGLLAYNIGPKNGGLKFIMEQYGATDFVTMQPYFQQLPRDYPIRVLSYSLAFRLWRYDGKLLAYQEGDNAAHIQRLGIPGLQTVF